MRCLLLAGWIALMSWFSISPAHAQAPEGRDEEARRNFKVGSAAFEAGEYEDALRYFERAYELSPRPQLLYNIGQAADRLRRDERAIEAFEGYLQALPEAANRQMVENRLEALKRARAEQAPPLPAVTEAERDPAPLGPVAPPIDEATRKPIYKRWWLWTAIGVIAAGGVASALLLTREGDPEPSPPTPGSTGIITYALGGR